MSNKTKIANPRQLAAVLAGLRLLQQHREQKRDLPDGIVEILEDAGAPLTTREIDDLCEEINVGEVVL
jgi:hypothetical protein